MRKPPLRGSRVAPAVEALEDRRLLSLPGSAPPWEVPARGMAGHAEVAPPALDTPTSRPEPSPSGLPWAIGRDSAGLGPGAAGRAGDPTATAFASRTEAGPASTPAIGRGSEWAGSPGAAPAEGWPMGPVGPSTPMAWTLRAGGLPVAPDRAEAPAGVVPSGASRLVSAESLGAEGQGAPVPTSGAAIIVRPSEPTPGPGLVVASRPSSAGSVLRMTQDSRGADEPAARPGADAGPSAVVVGSPADSVAAPGTPARGSSPSNPPNALGSPATQARPAPDGAGPKGVAGGVAPAGPPRASIGVGEGAGGPDGGETGGPARPDEEGERPEPRPAGLIVNLRPADRSTIGRIVDRFLEPLDGLSGPLGGRDGPSRLLAGALTVAVAALALDACLRLRRAREEGDDGDGSGFPGLPGTEAGAAS